MRSPSPYDDQASGLRKLDTRGPVQVVAVTGGKGGVGKSSVSVNLAIALAVRGRQVMLLDADLGLANVDVLLGLQPRFNLSHVLDGDCALEDIVLTGPAGMRVVPAASGKRRMADLSGAEHAGLIHAFSEIDDTLDLLLVDTAAGISDSVVSFTQASHEVVVVVCDEPASITDAYALIKVLSREHDVQRFRILANMTRHPAEGNELFAKITCVTDRFLDVTLEFLGSVPFDDFLRRSVREQCSVVQAFPESWSAMAFNSLAQKVDGWPRQKTPRGNIEFFVERLIAARSLGGERL